MQLLIAADLVPTKSNIDLFKKGDIKPLLGQKLFDIWNSADVRIFNLETPITDKKTQIDKWGPNLIAPTSSIKGIKALNPTLITLANNHIMDQGIQGFNSTKEILNNYNIPYVGVGDNLYEASRPYVINQNGVKIGVYACTEHEFTIAEENKPGANPFDPLESLDHISNLKSECAYVIVLYHGGKEHYRYPSPYLQKVCRKMVEKGADLVVTQHSHCIGCFENYKDGTIIYGQGNFIFHKYNNEYWNTSLIIRLKIKDNISVDYVPIIRTDKGVKLANLSESNKIMKDFYNRSKEILDSEFVEKHYEEFAKKYVENYLRTFVGFGKWLSRIDRYLLKSLLMKKKCNKKRLLAVQNYIECEAHRELVIKGISIMNKKKVMNK